MKVHVATYGCPSSQAASEIMMDAIKRQGHELVNEKSADVVVLNTCTVKYTTEQNFNFTELPVVQDIHYAFGH